MNQPDPTGTGCSVIKLAASPHDHRTHLKRLLQTLQLEYRPPEELRAAPGHARKHSPDQLRQIMLSIQTFGFTNPVLVDEAGRILAGHGRVKAATQLGLDRVPTIQLATMSEADKRAYALANNKLALNAGWDQKLLVKELRYIQELQIDYDLTLTGFSTPEIDLLFEADAAPPEPPLPMMTGPVVSQTGDLWLLGPHRLLCGDVTAPADLDRLMAGRPAQMVFTDPPYNVPIDGFCTGAGRHHHAEFAMASGEMSEAEFTRFLETILRLLAERCVDGALLYSCMDWRHLQQLLLAAQQVGLSLVNLIVWAKTAPGMGSFYRSQHELIPLFRKGGGKLINNVELGRHGRNRSNVWSYAAPSMLGGGRPEEVRLHPTVKPVKLVADALLDASQRRGIVLDPFLGSGTTLLAAENTGRHAYGLEIEPRYVDLSIRRWQEQTGRSAIHEPSGQSFDQLAQQRATEVRDAA